MTTKASRDFHKTAEGRVDRLNLPKDFIWKIGASLKKDLEPFLSPEIQQQFSKLLRGRDFLAYLDFCSDLGPNTLSKFDSLDAIRSAKILTYAENYPYECEGLDRSAMTLAGFFESEQACKAINRLNFPEIFGDSRDALFSPQLLKAQSFCYRVLGLKPDFSELLDCSMHGPGSDIGTERSRTSIFDKYANPPYTVSSRAQPMFVAAICDDSRWMRSLIAAYLEWPGFLTVKPSSYTLRKVGGPPSQGQPLTERKEYDWGRAFEILFPTSGEVEKFWNFTFKICDYNRYAEVPKTAKKNRSIALEPRGNEYLQLGAGELIRRRLKTRAGINLWTQEKNQRIAMWASRDDSCTTLDLSSASDRISRKLVEFLLPRFWFVLLDDLRVPVTKVADAYIPLEKMASMGNGFSFALESLVFASLIVGVVGEEVFRSRIEEFAIYGDDLIFPTEFFLDIQLLLTLVGCKVNRKKTFFRGPFRESCGVDYYDGYDIRPLSLKKEPTRAFELVIVYNRFYRLFKRWELGVPNNLRAQIFKWLPKGAHLIGPDCVTPEWWWIFTDDIEALRSVVRKSFEPDTHNFHLFFRRLHVSRKPQHIPKTKYMIFGELQEQYRKPDRTWDDLLFDTVLPFGSGIIPIGRNCPIEVRKSWHLIQMGAARYQAARG